MSYSDVDLRPAIQLDETTRGDFVVRATTLPGALAGEAGIEFILLNTPSPKASTTSCLAAASRGCSFSAASWWASGSSPRPPTCSTCSASTLPCSARPGSTSSSADAALLLPGRR